VDATTFVASLADEMQALFAHLGDKQTLEAESGGQVDVVKLLKLALKSELDASEIAAFWLPTTPEIDAKAVLAEQCSDEIRHFQLIWKRLEQLGEDMSGYDPTKDGTSPLQQYLRGLNTTIERIAAGPFACEAVAEVRNDQFIKFCYSIGDRETARLYEKVIQPEEIHHHRRGRTLLEQLADTPEKQELVAAAMRNSLAIADELQTLTEMTTGLGHIPLS